MGRIFDDITNDTPQNVYAGKPVAEFKALNADASKQYEEGRQAKDALDVMVNNLDLEDRNSDIKKRVVNETKAKFKELTSKGNYQDAKYVIDSVKKNLLTDNELTAAIGSRAKEKDYYATQKERYDKGEISKQDYLTGLAMTKLGNNQKIEYDPSTMTAKNSFAGKDIVRDQSDDIAKETMETIKDWKESAMPLKVNGDTFTTSNIGGVEHVFKNGTEVKYNEVANALKQQILNQDKYKDYLNQKNEFDKFNMLTDPTTGTKRNMQRSDLSYLKDDELKKIVTGFDENDIKKLEASKKPEDIATAKQARKDLDSVNLNDPKTLEAIHDKFNTDNTLTKMVYPAAEKASFQKLDYKLYNDEAALENLKDKHARAQKKYEYDLKNQGLPPITNTSTVQKYTGTQYAEVQKNMGQYKSDVAQKQAAFDAVKDRPANDPLRQTREKDLLESQSTLNVAKTHAENFYANITDDAKGKIANRVLGMFTQQEGGSSNWDYRISTGAVDDLLKTAKENKDYGMIGKLTTAKMMLEKREDIPEAFAKDLASSLVKPEYLPTLNDADDERVQRTTMFGAENIGKINGKENAGESGFPSLNTSEGGNMLGIVGGALLHHPTWSSRISNIMQKEYEDNNNMVNTNDIVTIPDIGKDNSPAAQTYHAIARSTFNNATEWTDPSGISFDKLLAGKFYSRDAKGNLVQATPDINKSQVAPAPGSNDGMTRVSVTVKDKDGNDLLTDGEDGQERGSFILKSGNPETGKLIYSTAAEYAKKNNDLPSYYKLKGDENFGKYFAPIQLGQNSDPITVFFPDGSSSKIKMVADGEDASKVVYADGKEAGKPIFDNKVFRSKEDLMQTFQMAYEHGGK